MSEREPAHTIACMDSWAKAQGLATYSEMIGTLRDLLDMWHGGHLQVRPEAEGAWLAAVQVGEAALARSGQAASGSSQGARSDEQGCVACVTCGQPEAPTAAPLGPVACIQHFPGFADRLFMIEQHDPRKQRPVGHVTYTLLYAHPPARSGAGSDDARDAARYRWLRENVNGGLGEAVHDDLWNDLLDGERLDHAIDAASAQPDRSEES